jgi:hypothetical protein
MKKKKKPFALQIRTEWKINPVSRIKKSKKIYSRKNQKIEVDE